LQRSTTGMVANVPDSTNRCRAQSGFIARIRGSDVRIGVICDEFGTFTQSPLYRQNPDLGETSGHVSFVPEAEVVPVTNRPSILPR